jgi:hypothetical protein
MRMHETADALASVTSPQAVRINTLSADDMSAARLPGDFGTSQ